MADESAPSKVLIVVDDNSLFVERLSRSLRGSNWELQSFANPLDCLAQLPNKPAPDVLLVDSRMPQMDGLELLTRLADAQAPAATKIFLCSEIPPPKEVQNQLNQLGICFSTKEAFGNKHSALSMLEQ